MSFLRSRDIVLVWLSLVAKTLARLIPRHNIILSFFSQWDGFGMWRKNLLDCRIKERWDDIACEFVSCTYGACPFKSFLVNVILIMSQDFSTSLMSLIIYPLSHQNATTTTYIASWWVCMHVHNHHLLSHMTHDTSATIIFGLILPVAFPWVSMHLKAPSLIKSLLYHMTFSMQTLPMGKNGWGSVFFWLLSADYYIV